MVLTPSFCASCGLRICTGLPSNRISPAVGRINAGKNFDERGLARPIFAQQHVHLAGPHIEVHALEREDAWKMLDDPAHFNKRSDFFYAHWSLWNVVKSAAT